MTEQEENTEGFLQKLGKLRWLKTMLKTVGAIVALLLIVWMAAGAYVYYNKKEILEKVTAQLNDGIKGAITIETMEPTLIRGFPGISVALENVVLRDSLWEKHRHDLVKAREVYIAINALSVLTGKPTIKDIRIKDGSIYLFTDSAGMRNTDIFRKPGTKTKKEEEGSPGRINRLSMENVKVAVDNQQKNKRFDFDLARFSGRVDYKLSGWEAKVRLRTQVNSFAFNTVKGSFLKNKELEMDLDMAYHEGKKQLDIPVQDVKIGGIPFRLGANFIFGTEKSDFEIKVNTDKITLKQASELLNPHIAKVLERYGIEKPLAAGAWIKGDLNAGGDPYIEVTWAVKNNNLELLGERITDASFTGSFINEWIKGGERNDPNSVIRFNDMKGNYYGLPFSADSIRITDLKNPVFTGRFRSNFPMQQLNSVLGGDNFVFTKGNAQLDLTYKAPYNRADLGQRFIYGHINFSGGQAEYTPRNLKLSDMNVKMSFKGRDLFIDDIRAKTGSSSLQMKGSVKDFSNLYYNDPERMVINWDVKSPQINLNEFMAFLAPRKKSSKSKGKRPAMNLDKALELAAMNTSLNVGKVIYKKFVATDVKASLTLNQRGIIINDIHLKHGGGDLDVKGNILQSANGNTFTVNSKINRVNVERLFYAFDNFGQDAITSKNLRGSFYGGTAISGAMKSDGQIIPRSFKGTVNFDIRNGQLVDFEPMTKVGNFAFPRRDFSNITFSSLKNTLTINGNRVTIPPMEIQSSVLNIFLDGVYSFSTGTDIAMQVPLRNPEKDANITDRELRKERNMKGIVINVRAVDGDDGKVKFKLGKRGN